MLKKIKTKYILFIILLLTAFLRFYQIWYPQKYVFDEVYHAFTAKEYLDGSKEAWEWWTTPPPGVAYEWTHPPLAKELMASSMFILHSQKAFAWRIPGVILGIIGVYLVFKLGQTLFKNDYAALISAFAFSLDGLNFVQSRTGMNDIYFVIFMLASVLSMLNRKFLFSAIFLGFSISSKWAAIYLIPFLFILLFLNHKKHPMKVITLFIFLIIVAGLIYLFSYLPFFVLGHTPKQFIDLQKQMFWYHTMLKAHHDYASPWWSWPLNLYPVWYFVDYQTNTITNIFSSGNLAVFWIGLASILLTIFEYIKTRSKNLLIILTGYLIFLLPWAFSPRIMFLYHYSPSVPFLSLALGHQLNLIANSKNGRFLSLALLSLIIFSFIVFYPILVGIPLPRNMLMIFFQTNLTKNPFGP